MIKLIRKSDGFSLVELFIIILVIVTILIAGFYLYSHHKTKSNQINSSTSSSAVSSNNNNSGQAPIIPTKSAYLGAWVNPGKGTGIGTGKSDEISQLATFNSMVGKPVAILHTWVGFKTPLPTTTLDSISQNGSIPLIDWGCVDVNSISSGTEDTVINTFANSLKTYNKPVFLRWYWEFNEMSNAGKTPAGSGCNGYNNGNGYISAWQHIYIKFQQAGVKNVSFVWCPGYSGGNFANYYPGDKYVDWIGIDRYERTKNQPPLSFSDMFSSYYSEFSSHNKPIMIAETAAMGSDYQSQYLTSTLDEAPNFPQIKAFVYFDSIGPAGDWSLTSNGIEAYKNLANSSYFSAPAN